MHSNTQWRKAFFVWGGVGAHSEALKAFSIGTQLAQGTHQAHTHAHTHTRASARTNQGTQALEKASQSQTAVLALLDGFVHAACPLSRHLAHTAKSQSSHFPCLAAQRLHACLPGQHSVAGAGASQLILPHTLHRIQQASGPRASMQARHRHWHPSCSSSYSITVPLHFVHKILSQALQLTAPISSQRKSPHRSACTPLPPYLCNLRTGERRTPRRPGSGTRTPRSSIHCRCTASRKLGCAPRTPRCGSQRRSTPSRSPSCAPRTPRSCSLRRSSARRSFGREESLPGRPGQPRAARSRPCRAARRRGRRTRRSQRQSSGLGPAA